MDWIKYLHDRGITNEIIEFAELTYEDPWIKIPYNAESSRPIKGRWLPGEPKESYCKYLWLDGSPTFPYLFEEINGNHIEHLYITEGEFDCLLLRGALQSAGLLDSNKVISLPLGVNCWKPEWTRRIGSSLRSKVIAVFDNDEAGKTGVSQLANRLQANIKYIVWPNSEKGFDVTDLWKANKECFLEAFMKLPYEDMEFIKRKDDLIVSKYKPLFQCDLELIKREVPIENEISKRVKLMKTSIGWKAHCPWHDDKIPSFTVYTKTNSFYCYSCGRGGSVIDFLMHINDWQLNSTIRDLIHNYGKRDSTNTTKEIKKERSNGGTDGRSSPASGKRENTI